MPDPLFTDIAELQAKIDAYFQQCDETLIAVQHAHSKGITVVKTPTPYTIAGLARALDTNREWINNACESKTYKGSDIVRRARNRIHEQNITLAMAGCHDSKIAALNLSSNFGYSSRSEVDHRMPDLAATLRDLDEGDEE